MDKELREAVEELIQENRRTIRHLEEIGGEMWRMEQSFRHVQLTSQIDDVERCYAAIERVLPRLERLMDQNFLSEYQLTQAVIKKASFA